MPPAGTYAMANAEALDLTAMPSNGWQFSHWTIYGVDTGHGAAPANFNPTDNPYNVNHGYGATYSYQAIFVPVGSTEPTPTPRRHEHRNLDNHCLDCSNRRYSHWLWNLCI